VSYFMIRSADNYIRLSSQFKNWPALQDAILGMLPGTARVDLD
jgi:hypothetical protein